MNNAASFSSAQGEGEGLFLGSKEETLPEYRERE